MHFVTGCVNTAKKAPAQGTDHHVSGPLQKKQKKREKKRSTRKKAGEKGLDERVRLQTGCQSVRLRDTGHGATVASHDATLRRGIQLVVVIA